ncbi:hypothetical protein LCGC14_1113170 [marine sediment metagenome]|uniref:Uncharacterized protein n=1 Tax=marine sediment metagenome TaxID=412755 RepID=A0A0F9PPB0_9ZZZZ
MDLTRKFPDHESPLLALILTKETTAPYVNENSIFDTQILPAFVEWGDLSVINELIPSAIPLLRCLIDAVYVLGVHNGLQRASNPIARLLEKEEVLDPNH